ncbi:MAG: hypothetical protein ACNS60_19175 [Candidatus Cyclobacteriaceae bacterium M2_1C_046]
MKSFKKILRLLGLVLLIVLASIGVGFGAGVPIPASNKKEDTIEVTVELVESNEDKTKLTQFDSQQQ